MNKIDEMVQELKEMNRNLSTLLQLIKPTENRLCKIPEAAQILGISQEKLRNLCKKGTIPAARTNENPNNKHYIIDIDQARKALVDAGHLKITKRGPKPTTHIS